MQKCNCVQKYSTLQETLNYECAGKFMKLRENYKEGFDNESTAGSKEVRSWGWG